jgi:hypothetical protein
MARARKSKDWSDDPLKVQYLAGVYEATMNLRRVGDSGKQAISETRDWTDKMAETYGGKSEYFTAQNGKAWWGWIVPLELRLEFLNKLENLQVLTLPVNERDGIRGKLEKAINNRREAES